jgi:endonuclease G, mitochondrial
MKRKRKAAPPSSSGRRKLSGAAAAAAMLPLALSTILPLAVDRIKTETSTPSTVGQKKSGPQSTTDSVHILLGNPSGATPDPGNADNFLMVKDQYCLSYNNTNAGPNWVSWHLAASDIGDEARGDFHPDDSLPEDFKMIRKEDYNNTKFDRGHVCNSKDRTDTRENNDATFFMTNILPQAPDNNQGPWRILEDFERSLAKDGNELYITAGAFGTGGTGGKGFAESIDNGDINVPKVFWKVIVVLPDGEDDLNRIDASTRTIAVCMPNTQGIRQTPWQTFVTTVQNVEKASGMNLLTALPAGTRKALEAKRDSEAQGSASSNPCQ